MALHVVASCDRLPYLGPLLGRLHFHQRFRMREIDLVGFYGILNVGAAFQQAERIADGLH